MRLAAFGFRLAEAHVGTASLEPQAWNRYLVLTGFELGGTQILIRPSHRERLFSSHEYSIKSPSVRVKVRRLVHGVV
jgi:hypothetical protein